MDLKKIADIYQLSPLQEYELARHLKTSAGESAAGVVEYDKVVDASDGACANTFSASSFLQPY
jgi:hypothetical protein